MREFVDILKFIFDRINSFNIFSKIIIYTSLGYTIIIFIRWLYFMIRYKLMKYLMLEPSDIMFFIFMICGIIFWTLFGMYIANIL